MLETEGMACLATCLVLLMCGQKLGMQLMAMAQQHYELSLVMTSFRKFHDKIKFVID